MGRAPLSPPRALTYTTLRALQDLAVVEQAVLAMSGSPNSGGHSSMARLNVFNRSLYM